MRVHDARHAGTLTENPLAGQPNQADCLVEGSPGNVCKLVAGGTTGDGGCGGARDFKLDKVGKQEVLYYAQDSSGNLGFIRRTVEIRDGSPPIIKLNADQRQGLGDNVLDPANEESNLMDMYILCKPSRGGLGCKSNTVSQLLKETILAQLQRPSSTSTVCRCTPHVEDLRSDSTLEPELRTRLTEKCPAETGGATNAMSAVWYNPSNIKCPANPGDRKANGCYEPRLNCEEVVTPAGIHYMDAGAYAEEAVFPKELEFMPNRVSISDTRSVSYKAYEEALSKKTVRIHNNVNVFPHKGASPVVHDVVYIVGGCHLLLPLFCGPAPPQPQCLRSGFPVAVTVAAWHPFRPSHRRARSRCACGEVHVARCTWRAARRHPSRSQKTTRWGCALLASERVFQAGWVARALVSGCPL
jgi:hypothetical protein